MPPLQVLYYFDTSTVEPTCIVAGGSLTVTIKGFNLDKISKGHRKLPKKAEAL